MRWFVALMAMFALAPLAVRGVEVPGGRIVYSRKVGDHYLLHLMNAEGKADQELPGQTAAVNLFPCWSPDGKRIAWMAGEDGGKLDFRICVANADGSGQVALDSPRRMNGRPCWSPDGKQIAFASGDAGPPGIYLWDLSNGGSRGVTMPGTGGGSPFWRKDGEAIGYTRLAANDSWSEIVWVKPDGADLGLALQSDRRILAGANALSPDGKRLLYFAIDDQTDAASLRLWEFEGKVDRQVCESGTLNQSQGFPSIPSAAWSPDGKWLLASLAGEKGWGIFRISPDGKTRIRLTPEGEDCRGAAWHAS
jgi:Tol biopolymer transport system component